MSEQTRNQEYTYQYRSVALAQSSTGGTFPRFCGAGVIMQPSIPDTLLELKNIYAHIVLRFDASVATANQKLLYLGGEFDQRLDGSLIVDPTRAAFVNVSADANRYIDCKMDLTKWKESMLPDPTVLFTDRQQPQLGLRAVTDLTGTQNITGDIILWKLDLIYTTKGIQ